MTYNQSAILTEAEKANEILERGWRQGSVFDPRGILENIPLMDGELLVLCTQSCTVVSPQFTKDPIVEGMVVKPLAEYRSRGFEATGKNQRKLHIEVINHPQFKCIECDINRRFFFDREKLLSLKQLPEFVIGDNGSIKLSGWIGRAYTRIALPNLLVDRMKTDLLPIIQRCLQSPINESISHIYLDWQPRHDISDLFKLRFIFLCYEPESAELLENTLLAKLEDYLTETGKNGIKIIKIEFRTINETYISKLTGYERFSEWDSLSSYEDLNQAPPRHEVACALR